MNKLLLKCIAAGLAGIYEIGMPDASIWLSKMSNVEVVETFKYYMDYRDSVKEGLKLGYLVEYAPGLVCNLSTKCHKFKSVI